MIQTLGMQWGWNHNPDLTKWSLTENPGYLRLKQQKLLIVCRMPVIRLPKECLNIILIISFHCYCKNGFKNMKEGDIAGLAVFQDPYAYIGIKKDNGKNYIIMVNNGKTIDSSAVKGSTIYLRASAIYGSGAAHYFDGKCSSRYRHCFVLI